MFKYGNIILLIFFTAITISCSLEPSEQIAEVKLVDYFIQDDYNDYSRLRIRHSIKNIGDDVINGWKVYFKVFLIDEPNIIVTDIINYEILPGEYYQHGPGLAKGYLKSYQLVSQIKFDHIDLY